MQSYTIKEGSNGQYFQILKNYIHIHFCITYKKEAFVP